MGGDSKNIAVLLKRIILISCIGYRESCRSIFVKLKIMTVANSYLFDFVTYIKYRSQVRTIHYRGSV